MRNALMGLAFLFLAVVAHAQDLTCDPNAIEPRSYQMTTREAALYLTSSRYGVDALDSPSGLAERALRIDPRNQLAHSILAREWLVSLYPDDAAPHWKKVFENGGAVGWFATLHNVDQRRWFIVLFDRDGIRFYRFGQFVDKLRFAFGGIPEFPGPGATRFWAAAAGCVDPTVTPAASIPWSAIPEIQAKNWVMQFKMTTLVSIAADGRKPKTIRELKLGLHGPSGQIEVYKPVGDEYLGLRGRGPASFQDAFRRLVVTFVDPERRIKLPPLSPGVGW